MKNILEGKSITLIFISAILTLILSLSGCMGGGNNGDNNNIDNTIQENSNIIYPNSKTPQSEVPKYYQTMLGISREGITLSAYETTDTVEDVLKWYENRITSLGYEVVINGTIAKTSGPQGTVEYGVIAFKRGNDAIGIWVMREPTQGKTIYFVGEGPADKLLGSTSQSYEQSYESSETEDSTSSTPDYQEVEKPQLPSSDKTSGEEPVKRYPDSVMFEHTVVTMDGRKYIYIKYGTDKDPEDVFNWYKDSVKDEGWDVVYTVSDGSKYSLTCKRNDEAVAIVIGKEGYTVINIEYIATQV